MRGLFFLLLSSLPALSVSPAPSYWIWAGLSADEPRFQSANLYVFQGEFIRDAKALHYRRQGLSPHPLIAKSVWLVYRAESLEGLDAALSPLLKIAQAAWKASGVEIEGVQLDYDSPSSRLTNYARFLRKLRTQIPPGWKLGITALADWSQSAPPNTLRDLVQATDEIVFQLYSGRWAYPDASVYLSRLKHLGIPFKAGRLENQNLERATADLPGFRGDVIFLQKEKIL
jgi:hypothetical protein